MCVFKRGKEFQGCVTKINYDQGNGNRNIKQFNNYNFGVDITHNNKFSFLDVCVLRKLRIFLKTWVYRKNYIVGTQTIYSNHPYTLTDRIVHSLLERSNNICSDKASLNRKLYLIGQLSMESSIFLSKYKTIVNNKKVYGK